MKRRALLVAAVPACTPLLSSPEAARARTPLPRIGVLNFGSAPADGVADPNIGLARGLRELGYQDGRNVVVEWRYADGVPQRLEPLAAELARAKVDVIVANGPAPIHAAAKATTTIPIVAVGGSDPIREGWARSLRQPGGNVTGLTVTYPELGPKRLELLKEALPGTARIAVLLAPAELDVSDTMHGMWDGARQLGLQLQVIETRGPEDFERAFDAARAQRAQALCAFATTLIVVHRAPLAALAARQRLPSISDFALVADAGFLMAYGADLEDLARRAAVHVDKILKGARPADMPIERPAKLELTINLRTARALGVVVSSSVLRRADKVIE